MAERRQITNCKCCSKQRGQKNAKKSSMYYVFDKITIKEVFQKA